MKDYNEMNDHELLMELVREKRRNEKIRYVRYGVYVLILLAVAILAGIYIPKIVAVINRYNRFMDQMQGLSEKVGSVMNDETIDLLDSVKSVMEKLQSILGKFGF